MLRFFTVGASHKSVPVAGLEELSRRWGAEADGALNKFREHLGQAASELCVLATCNRYEVYGAGSEEIQESLKRRLNESLGSSAACYSFHNGEAVRHVFRVAAGLDSMVLGETEILGQVKTAYETARQGGFTGQVLNTIFQKALAVGKRARSETRLSQGRLSVASVALELAGKIFADIKNCTVAVVGSGAMGTETARNLVWARPKNTLFLSRSLERAQALAREFGGQAATLDELPRALRIADIMVTQLSVETPAITRALVGQALLERTRDLFILDIGFPRNVEDAVGRLARTYLYNIDDLKGIAQANARNRQEEAEKAAVIIDKELEEFWPQTSTRLNALKWERAVPALH
ncbi:MAG: glutamyl-tRNA reductase [Elusimicrobia bacterium]|nr:glutamyl-tRNA reductase [Elusimicrobiota bacterium]